MMILNLNGSWELKDEVGEKLCQVEVPGSVISGLYAAGRIEHPYYRENEYETRDLFWEDYEFTRHFEVDGDLLAQKELSLVCKGLDTLTHIYMNGKELAATNNMHCTYQFPIKDYVHQGENEIRIVFHSVL